MAKFSYTARASNGASCHGTMDAEIQAEVSQKLRAEGKYPTSVQLANAADAQQSSGGAFAGPRGIKISRADLIQVSTQLSVMIETGVTLSEALDSIAQQSEKPQVKTLVQDVSTTVQGGSDLSS